MAKHSAFDWTKLIVAVVACQLIGNLGAVFTIPSLSTWYALLNKPSFNPPNWIFGPVWIILYTLMGISLYLAWKEFPRLKKTSRDKAALLFAFQLALNLLWSYLFFGLRSPLYGLICIALLWVAILATMLEFYGISRNAALALLPYILWVSFAAMLNLSILILNPGI